MEKEKEKEKEATSDVPMESAEGGEGKSPKAKKVKAAHEVAAVADAHEDQPPHAAALNAIQDKLPKGPRLCILGGTKFTEPRNEEIVKAFAKHVDERLSGKVTVLTG